MLQQGNKTSFIGSAIVVIIAGMFMFYASLIFYNTSPVIVTQGASPLDTTFQQSIPIISIVISAIFYFIAGWLLYKASRGVDIEKFSKNMWAVAPIAILLIGAAFYSTCYNHAWVLTRPTGGLTDEYVLQYYAAKVFLHLHNPYATNFTSQILQYVPIYYRTYLGNTSTFVHNIDYPAFSFLYYIPSALIGVSGIYQDIVVTATIVGFLCYKSPPYLRWFVPVFFFLDYAHVFFPIASITDICWVTLIILALLYRKKLVLSGILMGLAVSYKEEALVILPFFLILMWRELGTKPLIKCLSTVAITTLIINVPFLMMNPSAFIKDVLIPITANISSGGIGLSAFNLNISKHVYTVLFAVAIIIGLLVYYKKFDIFKISGITIFAMTAFWFNARSFQNYFIWLPIFTVVLIITEANKLNYSKGATNDDNTTTSIQQTLPHPTN
jgi:uncharacterized membrane protein